MKKLIVLLFCCFVTLAVFASQTQAKRSRPADNPLARFDTHVSEAAHQAVQQSNKLQQANARKATVKLTLEGYKQNLDVIIVKFTPNYDGVVVVENSQDSEMLDDSRTRGQLVKGPVVSNTDGVVKNAQWLQQHLLTKFTIPCKLDEKQLQNAKKIKPISDNEAASLAKVIAANNNR